MAAARGGLALLALLALLAVLAPAPGAAAERVLLRDVRALTLRRGRLTAARRAAPVPQLQCSGGAAGCAAAPAVAQCYNRGADGRDVQWECKADLESSYRFGEIEVSCEGYDYPGDPYILEGSCGLLFSLEFTEEGERRAKGSAGFGSGYYYQPRKDSLDSVPGAVVVIVLLALAYGVYKLFLSNQQPPQSFGDGFSGFSWQGRQAPPPPGFKATFTEPDSFGTPFSHGTSSGPGFWTGLGAGGLLGYLAGSHRAQPQSPYFSTWAHHGAVPPACGQPSASTGTGSSGTRTASGFGGTKRR